MLNQYPPGGAPAAINRQLNDNSFSPVPQQQSGSGGLLTSSGMPGMLGMPPPNMGTGMPQPGMGMGMGINPGMGAGMSGMGQPGMGQPGMGQPGLGTPPPLFDPNSVQNPQALSQVQNMATALSKPTGAPGSPASPDQAPGAGITGAGAY